LAVGELRFAREVSRLTGRGYALAAIAEAAALARRHEGAAIAAAGDEIEVRLNAMAIEASGQTALPFGEPGATLAELLDQAEEAEEVGDLPAARRLYEAGVMARPRDAVIRYNLACVLIGLSELDGAEIQLRIATSLDPSFAEATFNTAYIRRLKGDTESEGRLLRQAVGTDPDYVDALVGLSRWFIDRDQFVEAHDLLDRIERIGTPAAHEAFVRKAQLLCHLADHV